MCWQTHSAKAGQSAKRGSENYILGTTTTDTLTETMMFMLDLPPMKTRQKVEQVRAYFSAVANPQNTLHEAVKDTKGSRLGRGKSWTGQAEKSLLQECQLTELKQNKEWGKYPTRLRHLYETLLPENLGRHCRESPAGKRIPRSGSSFKETASRRTS